MKTKALVGIIFGTLGVLITLGVLASSEASNKEDDFVAGGEFDHLYFNTGLVVDASVEESKFTMEIEGHISEALSRDGISVDEGEVLFVKCARQTSFYEGCSFPEKGDIVTVGFFRPVSSLPIKAFCIYEGDGL